MDKFQFVTGIHGNERMPVLGLAVLGVKQLVANPAALAANKRFLERDMNASFGKGGLSLEEKRAGVVAKMLSPKKLVVDLHTFTAPSPPFVIIVNLEMLPVAMTSGIERVVYMKQNVKAGRALIDHFPGISVEMGQHGEEKVFERVEKLVKSLEEGKKRRVELYEVEGVYKKPGEYVNFVRYEDGSFPVLSGKNSYDHFGIMTKYVKLIEPEEVLGLRK